MTPVPAEPAPEGSENPPQDPDEDFALGWSRLLGEQGVVLNPRALRRLAGRTAQLLESPVPGDGAIRAGEALVGAHFTDPAVLGEALNLLLERPGSEQQQHETAAAFAVGWSSALRERTLAEQESIRLAADRARADTERRLRASEARFRALFEHAAVGIGIGDLEGNILAVNSALLELFGADGTEDFKGLNVGQLMHPEDTPGVWEAYAELVAGERDSFQADKPYYRRDGEVVWTHLTVSLIRDEDGAPRYQVAMLEDITDRHRLQERLRHQATHDPLTGLPNRVAFFDRLEALFDTPEPDARVGLCYVDLDGFKVVNDSLGHETGDQLLAAVAARLGQALGQLGYLVARLGGDEFVVLLEHSRGEQEAVAAAKAVLAALVQPVQVGPHRLSVGASVGVFERRVAATTPGAAVRAADLTLYRAKEGGRGRWVLYDPTATARSVSRYAVSVRMPMALDRGEFYVDYQPLVSLTDGRMRAVEALVRWRHPQLGVLGPEEFVATAEETGLIIPLGRWVLERACEQAAQWQQRFGSAAPQMNVNLAVRQARSPGLVPDLRAILAATGLDPARLQLEITESTVVGTEDEALKVLHDLVAEGVSLAVDDFGTGWSNLAYLTDLPVSGLKIAGSFVEDLHRDGAQHRLGSRIVYGLVGLAHTLGLKVTAEGVESAGAASRLRAMGCDWAQGWHFGQPMGAESLVELIERDGG